MQKRRCRHEEYDEELKNFHQLLYRQMRTKMAETQSLGEAIKGDVAGTNGLSSLSERLMDITMSDIILPEHSGWLVDQGSNDNVFCVVVDMIFCVFENEASERPETVILLPGCSVRSLVYRSAAVNTSQTDLSKTASGINKYQIVIDECSSRKKHFYSVQTKPDIVKWMAILKSASTLDNDLRTDDNDDDANAQSEPRRHSICGPVTCEESDLQSHVTPKYTPSSTTANRQSKLTKSSSIDSPNHSPMFERRTDLNATASGTNDSLSAFRRKLRREDEREVCKPQPLKATHFQGASPSSHNKKSSSPFRKLKSFGSLDNLFKRRGSKGDSESADSNSLDEEDRGSNPSLNESAEFATNGFHKSASTSDLESAHTRRLSSSLDYGKSDKGLSKGLFRTASDLKEKLSGNKLNIRLRDLEDPRMTGYLQMKHVLKWHNTWFVISKGHLYGFKSNQRDELATMALKLHKCEINYNIQETSKKFKRAFVFKLSQKNKKSFYLNAATSIELGKWLQCLHMESNSVQSDSITTDDTLNGHDVSTEETQNPLSKTDRSKSVDVRDIKLRSKAKKLYKDDPRRYSCPINTLNGETHGDSDIESESTHSSTDDTGSHSSKASFGLPSNDFPEHDPALKQVWTNDRNYLFNLVRAKLRSYRKRRETGSTSDLTGANCDLIMVNDDRNGESLTTPNVSVYIIN